MNISRLLSQEPFNKWVEKFLQEYTKSGHCAYIQPIGSSGFRSDIEVATMFIQIMLREKEGGFVAQESLVSIFYAWYEINSMYHTNYAPPKVILLEMVSKKFDFIMRKDQWGYKGLELVASTPEEADKLVRSRRGELQFQLPNFKVEETLEDEERRHDLRMAEMAQLERDMNARPKR
jgi:hypothetical protein